MDEKLGLHRPCNLFEAPRVVYYVLGAAESRAAAAPVALPLGNDGSRLLGRRRHDSSLSGLLRFHGHPRRVGQTPRAKDVPKDILVEFYVFVLQFKGPAWCCTCRFKSNRTKKTR